MIFRSVVGKLWMTIIVLVALVLLVFSLFLSQRIEKTYYLDQEKSLQQLADEIQHDLGDADIHLSSYVDHVTKASQLFDTYMFLLNPDGSYKELGNPSVANLEIKWQEILQKEDLAQVLAGQKVSLKGNAPIKKGDGDQFSLSKHNVLLVAVPYQVAGKTQGAIVLYQAQDQLSELDIKRWIFYSAGIGILLTTVFAFFLSTRITQPLVLMKTAVEKMSRGQFSTRVPVRTHERDEIADLAVTFNRMAGQLEESIHLLSQEKEQLSSILRSMSDGVITLDAKGTVTLTNPPAEQLLKLLHLAQGDSTLPEPLEAFYQQVVADHKEHMGDITIQGYTFVVVMAPLYADNQVRGVVAVTRDMTEERRLDKLRKDFVANVSHELRTPLAMLQGYSEALIDEVVDTPEARREIAEVINEESQRMGRLVHELLDLARMEAGHISVESQPFGLEAFIQRIVRKFQTVAREQQITLTSELQDPLPDVCWDEDKVEQVLTNLIDNAFRHTSTGGTVNLAVHAEKDQVILLVKDTGCGMTEEDLPFIFERFYKADKARTRGQSGGTGLGLSIVKHLVVAHQGQIVAKSEVGKGTEFMITLPQQVRVADNP